MVPIARSSNGVPITFDEQRFAPMRDSSDVLCAPDQLRGRYAADGYVLLRGLLDPDEVLALRGDYFARFDPSLLAAGTAAVDGIFSGALPPGLPDHGTPGHPAHDLVRSGAFDSFTRDERLESVAEVLLGGPVSLVPRRIVRHFHRGSGRASRAHVDIDYLDHGSDDLVTAWVPLGDCTIDCGGLVYLEGSHRASRRELDDLRPFTDRPHDPRPISNDLGRTAELLGGRWLWTDYRAGDVVLHSPHTVHASLDNVSDVMRLSADVRFRLRGAAPDQRWNGNWSADDGY